MQAYAEGWELLQKVDLVDNVTEVFDSWRAGTVIRSWLLDLLVAALDEDDGDSTRSPGYAEDSGEGRWTVEAAIDNAVPLHAITAALFARFQSRQDESPAMKAIAAMRNQFGGHAVKAEETAESPPHHVGLTADARCTSPTWRWSTSAPTRGRDRPRARRHGVHRPQRAGQDQPGRGDRLRRHPVVAPGRERPAAGALRRRPGDRADDGRTRRPPGADRARDQPRQGQPGTAQPRGRPAGARRARRSCARCCSRPTTSSWSRATRARGGGSSTICWWLGSRGSPASAPTTTGCSSSATACSKTAGGRRDPGGATRRRWPRSTVWDAHLAQRRLRSCWRPARPGRLRCDRTSIAHYATVAAVGRRKPTAAIDAALDVQAPRSELGGATARDELEPVAARGGGAGVARGVRSRDDAGRAAPRRPGADRSARCPPRGYASHGESWSFALALRLAAFELLRADGDDPVLILDDVFAELDDAAARAAGGDWSRETEQVLVTAAVPDDVPDELVRQRFDVRDRRGDAVSTDDARRPDRTRSRRSEPAEPRHARPDRARARPLRGQVAASGLVRAGGRRRARAVVAERADAVRRSPRRPRPCAGRRGRRQAGHREERLGDRPRGARRVRTLARSSVPRSPTHCEPESFADGLLHVRTDSTAWATQLKLLAPTSCAGSTRSSATAPSR